MAAEDQPLTSLPPAALWEPNFSKPNLERLALTPMFDQGFRMVSVSPGDLMFPSFPSCFQDDLFVDEIIRRRYPTYIGVDLAGDKRPGNFIVAVSVDPATRKRYPVEVLHGAWRSPETAGRIADVCTRHNVACVMVENNAYQESLIDWIREARGDFPYWHLVEGHTTGKNKADPTFGLPGLEIQFRNRAWAIPHGLWNGHPKSCQCSWCVWAGQMSIYPRGAATDAVMGTWFAETAASRWSLPRGISAAPVNLGNLGNR